MSEVRASIVAKKAVKTAGAKGGRKKNCVKTHKKGRQISDSVQE